MELAQGRAFVHQPQCVDAAVIVELGVDVLVRTSEHELSLARGHQSQEHYQRIGKHFCLTAITLRGGARVTLHYDHQHAGQTVLSDLITYQGDTLHQHIHTQLDDNGRINALWLMNEGAPLRQLAGYDYDEHGISAISSNGVVLAQSA